MVYGREGKKHSMDLLTRPPGTAARKRLGTIEITSVTVIELDTVPSPSRTALTLVDLGTLLSSRIVFFFFRIYFFPCPNKLRPWSANNNPAQKVTSILDECQAKTRSISVALLIVLWSFSAAYIGTHGRARQETNGMQTAEPVFSVRPSINHGRAL